VDATWAVDSFVSAVLAQVGVPESPSAPAPALDQIAPQLFNIMCIPDLASASTADQETVIAAAYRFCKARQAFLIVDPPPPSAAMMTLWLPGADAVPVDNVGTPEGMKGLQDWAAHFVSPDQDAAAVYYPWVQITDPFTDAPRYVPPSGTVAGVYAAADASRGVWKAPAGVNLTLQNVTGLADLTMNDTAIGTVSVGGINCLRTFPVYGNVIWGARTLAGRNLDQSPFKYVSTRRLGDFIQQSLQQSLTWAAFEPNGPALWSAIALETPAFMSGLYGAGAFSGATAAQAFEVVCDATTTSVADRQAGIVNLSVAFAHVDPAEFLVLTITLKAGAPTTT
jgi:hypothetical protein